MFPFGATKQPIEDSDSDDEMDELVSLTDTVFDADIPDSSEEDTNMSMSTATRVPRLAVSPAIVNTSSSPASSYASSICDDLGALPAQASPSSSDKHFVQRRVKSSTRHKAYSVPSRGQREAFKKYTHRRKDMFVESPLVPIISNGSQTLSPAFDPLSTSGTDVPLVMAHQAELYLPALLEDKCSLRETLESSESAQAGSLSTPPHVRVTKKSGLTIKIPGLVDRLALRLIHSCNVAEQDEEDLSSSPDGYTASESSFEGEQDHILRPCSPCSSPDRLSRRQLRRRARKELWLNSEVVPAVLLPPFSLERHTRSLRSGRRY
ncbi:hypothetical protein EI94DRAFT_1715881 [Lactarius quietus]|nr:hypothetical protein EI94DRAFT_1715881 [Lactarius quietus]